MNGVTRDETRDALNPADYVPRSGVWVPRASTTAPTTLPPTPEQRPAAPSTAQPMREPAAAPDPVRGQVVTVGTGSGQLSAATGLHPAPTPPAPAPAARPGPDASTTGELPDGVLARITNGMAAAIGAVAFVGMAEAAFNLGRFVFAILQLPLPLAIGFPAIFEIAAATFAVQDARDRRQGHANTAMRVATYLTLIASSAVNGIVGFASHGLAGLIEIVPPLMLASVIHLHGDRATRAWHSQAVLRPAWREAQLKAARRESVMDVLPLLAGTDEHGRATVEMLRQRLDSETLEPGEALLAAGWFDRLDRDMTPTMLRRLETVAATVWGTGGAPIPDRAPTPIPARTPRPTGPAAGTAPGSAKRSPGGSTPGSSPGSTTRSDGSRTGSTPRSGTGSTTRSNGGSTTRSSGSKRSIQELRARSIEDLIAELDTALETGALSADSTITAVREHLQVHPDRARALHKRLQESAATPPQPGGRPSPERVPSPSQTAGDGTPGTGAGRASSWPPGTR